MCLKKYLWNLFFNLFCPWMLLDSKAYLNVMTKKLENWLHFFCFWQGHCRWSVYNSPYQWKAWNLEGWSQSLLKNQCWLYSGNTGDSIKGNYSSSLKKMVIIIPSVVFEMELIPGLFFILCWNICLHCFQLPTVLYFVFITSGNIWFYDTLFGRFLCLSLVS